MVISITDILNQWAAMGVFSYVIPFLLIFAVVFAILKKAQIFEDNKAINSIIAAAIALLALLNDHVSRFYEVLFPRFGIGLSIFLVLVILLGFFYPRESGKWGGALKWVGWLTGIGVVLWAWTSWDQWGYGGGMWGVGSWFGEYFWSLIILGAVIGLIVWISKSDPTTTGP